MKDLARLTHLLNTLHARKRAIEAEVSRVTLDTPRRHIVAWKQEHAGVSVRIQRLERRLL